MWIIGMILIMYTVAVIWTTLRVYRRINASKFGWILGKFRWPRGELFCGPMITVTPSAYRRMRPGIQREPDVYQHMSSCQNYDYSAQNYILRPCKDCDAAYSRFDMGRLGLDVNLQNRRNPSTPTSCLAFTRQRITHLLHPKVFAHLMNENKCQADQRFV